MGFAFQNILQNFLAGSAASGTLWSSEISSVLLESLEGPMTLRREDHKHERRQEVGHPKPYYLPTR
jgi:hypothetical protein